MFCSSDKKTTTNLVISNGEINPMDKEIEKSPIKKKTPRHETTFIYVPTTPKPSRFRRKKDFRGETALSLSLNYYSEKNKKEEDL